MTEGRAINLREAAGETLVSMPMETAFAIARLGIASLAPTASGEWRVTAVTKVGVVRLGPIEVRIEPKVPLERLFYLLARGNEWGTWFQDSVHLDTIDDLYPAIADAFATLAERVLRAGVLRSYRLVRSAEPAIRGKWMVSEQIRTQHGMPLPAELEYDEFTIDISENQMVRSAVRRVVQFPGLPDGLRARLLRLDLQLSGVSVLARGRSLPGIQFDRRNERYRPALALAELILTNGSLDHRVGGTTATGFLIDLPGVFEKFVETEVRRAARPYQGTVLPQWGTPLDLDGKVRIKPDLVWHQDGRVRAVFDAKYKAEKPAGFPNADVYQMLTYCVRHGLSTGHLIYAAGNAVPARYTITQAGIEIYCHSLALDRDPLEIASQVDEIVVLAVGESLELRT